MTAVSFPHHPVWDPATDSEIFQSYTLRNLAEKRKNKVALQKLIGLHANEKTPLVGVLGSFVTTHGIEQAMHVMQGIVHIGGQLIITHRAHTPEHAQLLQTTRAFQGNAITVEEDERAVHRVLAGCDILLFPSPAQPSYVPHEIALRYAAVPIAPMNDNERHLLHDYDPRTESGNAFLYMPDSSWSMFASIVRAFETYKLTFDWKGIQRNGMELFTENLPLDDDDAFLTA